MTADERADPDADDRAGRLVTRAEAAVALGYSPKSFATVMSRHPKRWPAPVARRKVGRAWQHLYDLDAMRAAAAPSAHRPPGRPFQGAATVSDDDGLITCLECGQRMRALGRHLVAAHGTTAAAYRVAHRLPASAALVADDVRAEARDRQRARLADDPAALDHLRRYHDPAWARRIAEAAHEPREATRGYEIVREHRLPGQQYAVRQMVAARLSRLDDAARARGYADLDDAIDRTRDMPAAAAARRIGVSPQTVARRRRAQDTRPRRA